MAGTLTNTLTAQQLEWLNNNLETWYGVDGVTIAKYSTWTYVLIMKLIPSSTIATIIQLNNDGSTSAATSQNISGTGYWANVYNGLETTNMYYYYLNHGDNQVDSEETIDIPMLPTTRIIVDTKDLVGIKDTKWTWLNLYKILTNMQSEVNVIPSDVSRRQNIAFEWDSNMSYRLFSPYMMAWLRGRLNEQQISDYLLATYKDKWNKMYAVMIEEYNPLDNYNMHEVEHIDDVKDEVSESEASSTGETTDTIDNTVTTANNITATDKVYGFDSETAANAGQQLTVGDNVSTTAANNGSTSTGSSEGNSTYVTDNDLDRELTRAGNIGVTTSQQLMEAELKVRENIILNMVRDDITSVLTLPYYGGKY